MIPNIKESLFMTLDKNQDFRLDIGELSDFLLVTMAKIDGNLKNGEELLRVFKLFDKNQDGKLCMGGKIYCFNCALNNISI